MRMRFITRGGKGWGLGHLHRVSWLASELAGLSLAGVDVEITCLDDLAARGFWRNLPAKVQFEEDTTGLVRRLEAGDVAVFDWLDSPPELIHSLAERGVRVVLLDEYGPAQAVAELVLNCLLAPLAWHESQVDRARVLSGSALLQLPPAALKLRGIGVSLSRAFLATPASAELPEPTAGPVRSVLVSCGGSAQAAFAQIVLSALQQAKFTGKIIMIPAPDPPPTSNGLDLDCHPAGEEFHGLLAASDLAILGGGLSLYEALFLGVPSIALALPSATPGRESHQSETAAKLAAAGACIDAGCVQELKASQLTAEITRLLTDGAQRRELSRQGSMLFDGHGLARTLAYIMEIGGIQVGM